MQDFIRIGGPIVSSPLNENFRRMAKAIDMANTNMIFSDEDGVKDTIDDMLAINSPLDGQVCYVVSSGEFYRYSARDEKWHKIMDIGQTFRQGFLNSGAVIIDGALQRKDDTTITLPNMLIYFKNKDGDGRYLRGMYRILEHDLDLTQFNITQAGCYSIYTDEQGTCTVEAGMPTGDSVDTVFLGAVLIDSDLHIVQFIKDTTSIGDGVYTLPDIAYTDDRGHFLVDGGQASGLNLAVVGTGTSAKISRAAGYYYDEGMGYANAPTDTFPATTDNRSNFNIKRFEEEAEITDFIYLYPNDTFNNPIEVKDGIVYDKYIRNGVIEPLTKGFYTIQQHLVLPDGKNVILYGTTFYNSFEDAYSHINDVFGVNIDFPYVEASRLIVGTDATDGHFDITDPNLFRIISVGRLSQIGTFTPEFSDAAFKVYSADVLDVTPASIKFDLLNLQADNYQGGVGFGLVPLHNIVTRDYVGSGTLNELYLKDDETTEVVAPDETTRTFSGKTGDESGYELADNEDLRLLSTRVAAIEREIWETERIISGEVADLYKQAIRYRLYKDELHLDEIDEEIEDIDEDLANKVNKGTTINGYTLGDYPSDPTEEKVVTLVTNDIDEPQSNITHRWFTEQRVRDTDDVIEAVTHARTRGTGSINDNPHALSTDDITVIDNIDRNVRNQFISLNELDALTHPINFYKQKGTPLSPIGQPEGGPIKDLTVYTKGFLVDIDTAHNFGTVAIDNTETMMLDDFALSAKTNPTEFAGAVDRAVNADHITDLNGATENQYYGTDENAVIGVYDLPVYVSTADAEGYTSADETAFEPIDHSVVLKHLANSRVNYPASYEESKIGTNVYDLVKYHYHKVYNSGTQGPYISGTTTQDVNEIYYSYKVPAYGLNAGTYYFSYGNNNYRFTISTNLSSGKELIYTPSLDRLSLDGTTITKISVQPEDVVETQWLSFVSRTSWNNINEWNFGDNLTVTVTDGRATINAAVAGSGASNFANLGDVDVLYTDADLGKTLILDKDSNNNFKIKLSSVNMHSYMKEADYSYNVTTHVVKKAHEADIATTALNANKLQDTYTVNDGSQSNTTLWTSNQIVSDVSTQIQNEGVRTYNGTSEPSASLGKEGDLYILLED